jgi:hypothetical protein
MTITNFRKLFMNTSGRFDLVNPETFADQGADFYIESGAQLLDNLTISHGTDWMGSYPELLLKAALWQLEISYRNTEGAKDWMQGIMQELTGIDMTTIRRTEGHINQMRG